MKSQQHRSQTLPYGGAATKLTARSDNTGQSIGLPGRTAPSLAVHLGSLLCLERNFSTALSYRTPRFVGLQEVEP